MTAVHTLRPDWPAPARVQALTCADARRVGELSLPAEPVWLEQVHGVQHVEARPGGEPAVADAAWTREPDVVCVVRTADCLPVLLCDRAGTMVMAVHAGWRGLCAGVIDLAVDRFAAEGIPPGEVLAWLGPAICPQHYEIDAPVYEAFMARVPDCREAFRPTRPGHWQLDLFSAARRVLEAAGRGVAVYGDLQGSAADRGVAVYGDPQGSAAVYGGPHCTFEDPRWPSYRRDPGCGRMASLIWLAASP